MTWRSACNHLKVVLCLIPALVLCSVLFAQNAIVTENALPGNPISEWGVPDFRDNRIAGFATKMSLNRGETVRFKISSQSAASFTLKIYRIGYYGGNGARLQGNLGTFPGKVQPAGISDAVTGLLDCSNWTQSASWFIPTNAVSGMYIAKLERSGGGSNHIVFIVRNDASNSDLYFQIPDATWQAYNAYGGSSLYDGTTGFPAGHAVKVSYNRPFFIYNASFRTDGRGSDWYMNAEYPIIRWLERNGYNLTYTCSNDVARNGSRLLNHKVFITSGHDEYWSKEQRNNVEAARNAGIHIAFFTGNEVYWKTRWESFDGSESRTLVCYKEGLLGDGTQGERTCGSKCDGSTNEWTGLWRTGGNYDAGKPENALIGQISWVEFPGEINVPAFYKKLRFWRNTSIANLSTGQTAVLGFRTLGYEWDFEQYPDSYPAGRITMSSTTISGATHKLSLYRHSSGALVFGAGTVQWSWGLDGQHLGGTATISAEMQQATVNLFADMGVQPGTLQSGLVTAAQSGDATAPSATITSPANGATFASGATINITGTATDAGGGVVAGVEVSVDGGATWKPATLNAIDGTVSWSFSWSAAGNGTFNIRCRGFDDSGNIGTAGAGINISVGGAAGSSNTIFQVTDVPANPRANDGQAISLGVRFRSSQNGFITGIRYFKGSNTTGVHTGHLWTNTGTQLAQATFANETASGWQQVLFSSPVAITADVTYVASCFSPSGDYASTVNYFTQAVVNGPLRALFDGENGINGVYRYSPTAAFPINGHLSSNYWVDVVFTTNANPDNTPPTVVSVSPLNGATGVSTGTTVVANFSEAMNGSTVTSSTFQLKQGTNVISASRTTTGSQVILRRQRAVGRLGAP